MKVSIHLKRKTIREFFAQLTTFTTHHLMVIITVIREAMAHVLRLVAMLFSGEFLFLIGITATLVTDVHTAAEPIVRSPKFGNIDSGF